MSIFYQILLIISALIIIWIMYRSVKGNPEAFSKANINKSFYAVGLLALVLIGFITLLVLLLRSS